MLITKRTIKEFIIITVGIMIVAAAVFFFMMPSHLTIGSGAALAIMQIKRRKEK